jgi:Asp-tRNA(Asn)/Glu-tRNA(Gln) amidotransferase A subunit family amidase
MAGLSELATIQAKKNVIGRSPDEGWFRAMTHAKRTSFGIMEKSVSEIHDAIQSGALTCRYLIQQYLDRIHAYDQQGPKLNALVYLNPKALEQAAALDQEFKRTGQLRPLHGIPVVLKDNYDTADMPTTAGSAALAGSVPLQDAATVAKLRHSGALILAKANLHELALAGLTFSSLTGQTKNPYDLTRTPGGSSGGTGAALAANFATLGTGSDTMNSIRSPSSANSLVGLRPTRGLISRTGVVPVSSTQDAVGPITRNVADAARMLDAMSGYDPKDPVTAFSLGCIPKSYSAGLDRNALQGARLGVLKTLFGDGPEHQEVNRVMEGALEALRRAGAALVPVADSVMDTAVLAVELDVQKYEFKTLLNSYLQSLGPKAQVRSLADILASGKYLKSNESFLLTAENYSNGLQEPDYWQRLVKIGELKVKLANLLAENNLDALVFPHQKRLAVSIGEPVQADRNGILASLTGFPAITVPGGFSPPTAQAPIGVPVGIEFLGRPWSELQLLRLAYSFEQTTHLRKPPQSTPALA